MKKNIFQRKGFIAFIVITFILFLFLLSQDSKKTQEHTDKNSFDNKIDVEYTQSELSAITNSKLKTNFSEACQKVGINISEIRSLEKKDDWNSGPRYTFFYNGQQFALYALENGTVSSITIVNNFLDKIYLDGYESVDVKDFMIDITTQSKLNVKAEEKIKENLKYPSTAKFKWTECGYGRRYDIYQITGKYSAKNAMGVEGQEDFVIEFKVKDDNYKVVYLKMNNKNIIGSGSQAKEISRKEIQSPEPKSEDSSTFIIKDGVMGTYGKKDKFDGEDYIRYYIPSGKYKVKALTKNAQFYVETIKLHKEDGYDNATTIRNIKLNNVGDTDEFNITSDQCISLVVYTQIELTKIQ